MDRHELLTRFQLQRPAPAHRLAIGGLSPAAVLIPVVMRDEGLSVLLTRRSPRLRHHGGQISFPGGRQDPGDENLIATALRETEEELGIPARLIEVIGTLNPLNTVSRFEVLPVLGLLNGNYPLILSPDEVDHAFEVPLTHLLDRRNHIPLTLSRGGKAHTIYWIPWQQHFIWGATASMINQLAQHLAK
ncbi:CoA pyrophosphatase [Aeromonas veronii]|uniref:CoA pyrophosphatase n=1 Tax=Aeromonas veronii TaxID=654 RepID=UPI000718A307|nr:CoA pyrophosphatase [Aeromonas veronii]KRV94205.1 NUDIX hydrolase [Aeromonas veronii]KRV96532.1 NUDIX hydrolase [Aeromonas veronii]KRW05967.1 NUDIX hydrolase [Aeromonas veronii]KRW14874.1 NUDIX hydrolase [Aeromonas veronii]KRW15257.1 NUDIX hydrolase [Aeromonas veronii]